MKKLFTAIGSIITGAAIVWGTIVFKTTGHTLKAKVPEGIEYKFDFVPEKLVMLGDTGMCNKGFYDLAAQIDSVGTHVTINGDLGYPTGLKSQIAFDGCLASVFRFSLVSLNMGNHDFYEKKLFKKKMRENYFKYASKHQNIVFDNDFYVNNYNGEICQLVISTYVHESIKASKLEEDQQKFIDKFLVRTDCKIKIVNGHHGPYASDESHGKEKLPKRRKKMWRGILKRVHAISTGHSHLTAEEKAKGKTRVLISGASSKLNHCTGKSKEGKSIFCNDTELGGWEYDTALNEWNAIFLEKEI